VKPEQKFLSQPKHFWANVRSVSQQWGYTDSKTGRIKVPSPSETAAALKKLELESTHIVGTDGKTTAFGEILHSYFQHRASVLYDIARPHLMDGKKAESKRRL
jgi:hypothetical protein